jgi:hypothetical protein
MILRADHVAGATFVVFGLGIFALSGDLPTGQLSMPGSGFMPKLIAGLMIILGIALALQAGMSGRFSEVGWSDAPHAAKVIAITAAGITLYTVLGFILTLVLMLVALLVIIERRNILRAAGYSICVVLLTYCAFEYLLRTPLPPGLLGD